MKPSGRSSSAVEVLIPRWLVPLSNAVLAPLLLLGAVLTLSLFGAFFGIPILLLAGGAWLAIRRARHDPLGRAGLAAVLMALIAAAKTGLLMTAIASGWDDIDDAIEVVGAALGTLWILATGACAVGWVQAAFPKLLVVDHQPD